MNKFKSVFIFLLFLSSSIFAQKLFQVSYYEALNKSKLDGVTTLKEVLKYGNTGIGGYHALDGEMILVDGKFYRIPFSGKVNSPILSEKVCFAAVYNFKPEQSIIINGDSNLYNVINRLIPDQETIIAIKVYGTFNFIKTRSVPGQKKPYPTLSEIVKTQAIFEGIQIKGTLTGIRTPAFTSGLNPPGYHLHFISEDKSFGGHLLEMRPQKVKCEIMTIKEMTITLPDE